MEKLLEKRTTVYATEFPKIVKASWPFGKVTLFQDHLTLSAVFEEYTLSYSDIEIVEFQLMRVIFHHHNSQIPKTLMLSGPLIPGIIRRAIKQFNLPIITK
jgi:hypothetical protein